ncbi:hypothetical protein NOG67_13300 [Erwinia persicina]|uniref:hypothetical protein n=1 Tax=Erwinia persicina TaxID=55211 RepID=UPI0007887C1D|nr:hypothetical protein [Erwinia persicina]MCQ4105160.1 hypothetical protein [Erwinia persicina]UTX11374.1 hypothetical protein NOG67_13300 [Erwinia persicina]
MNEQQVNALLEAMQKQTQAQNEQTVALNRLAESNESLAAVLYQTFAEEIEVNSPDFPMPTYLSGKVRG